MSENKPPDEQKPVSLVTLRDQRERAIARLSDAFAHDHLDLEEFERRLGIAHRTDSIAELAVLTQDLIAAPDPELSLGPAPATRALVPGRQKEQQTLAAIIGGTSRKGHWTPPRRLRVIAVMGGAELDFREAAFAPGVTEVHITAVMGGVQIIVPPKLAVEMEGLAIMGGFEHSERAPVQPDPDRPVLRVSGVAVWGGVHIETRLPGETEEDAHSRRRAHRALQKAQRHALPPRRDT